ncbi:MAG: Bax inhibitor-1/YccA family protein [Ignavibacteriae bacterium]|nr:Bax inhibitor-1/YccA family protein [Ignavibacteriota bacterium]
MRNTNEMIMPESEIVKAQQDFLSKVYAWMVGGLLITSLTAWYIFSTGFWKQIVTNSILFYGLIIGEVALVFILSSKVQKMTTFLAGSLFILYSAMNGLTLSVILAVYTAESVQQVFLISAAMFAGLSVFGFVTKKDLSGIGRFMFMGLIGLLLTMVINLIMGSSMLDFLISVVGVIVFSGLTAYDTQKLKEMYMVQFEGGETAAKASILGALTLYLDFINLFIFLLRLLGNRR